MIKINDLKVEQLKDLLREKELPCTGLKAELVQRLTEAVKGDEVFLSAGSSEYCSATSDEMVDDGAKMLQAQMNVLTDMMKNLISVVQTSVVNQNGENTFQRPASTTAPLHEFSVGNPIENVRDVASLLPEFDPLNNNSLNSIQFVRRVEMLKSAYRWSDNTILFVVQQKLLGSAKLWIDTQEIFVTWEQFRNKFLQDFPCDENPASVHIKLSKSYRYANESPQEYFYRMVAIGRRGCLREEEVAHHIINGINDSDLRKVISRRYLILNDLLQDINTYCGYNSIKYDGKNRNAENDMKFNNVNRNGTIPKQTVRK
uniref:SAP domain-containing protein n=1 Tax=Stomoxys calcitrans TaxID=35570 RepID=A0A1I8NZF4_STOCA